jgi:hypothetical protein
MGHHAKGVIRPPISMSLLRRIDDRWDRAAVLIDEALNLQVLPVDEEDRFYLNYLSTELVLH